MLLLAACASACSWSAFVRLPLDQKYLLEAAMIQNSSLPGSIKQMASQYASGYSINHPAEYATAMESVQAMLVNVSMPVAKNTTMIKVGGVYVSQSVCQANPKACVQPAAPGQQAAVVQNKRTPGQCLSAREKDWDSYCYIMYNSQDKVNCAAVSEANKDQVLDSMAAEPNTNQGACLSGG